MIDIWLEERDSRWYGAALHKHALVATAAARSRQEALHAVLGALPAGAPRRFLEKPSDECGATVRMLADLEQGKEENKRFELSCDYVPEPLRSVLRVAASIPLGYVSTYGSIAAVAHTDAQTVGQIMASNPLYPVVPCHRVVGAGFALVGYGGSRKAPALLAKLERLRKERRGFREKSSVEASGGPEARERLKVAPVEWAIMRAVKDGVTATRQLDLW
jgi:methylated-DNA-[protein]-cysteine S-methyltransferase